VFTSIPLSLPEPYKIVLNVIVYRLPNELKDLMKGDKHPHRINRIDSARSDELKNTLVERHESDDRGLLKFQESFKYVTNDQPIHICLKVEKDIKITALV